MSNVVIVESPAKISKISGYLGQNFKVMASVGHFRDLPKKSLGIDINNNYKATYEITNNKVVVDLKKVCSKAKTIYIATDNDREGNGICWHLMEVLKIEYPKAKRMVFNEITKSAILKALEEADKDGKMDINAVNSYFARRFVDKIAGFKISPLLWKNISGAKSAGRVQSVATKLVVDKELEITKHIPEEKYNISGIFNTSKKETINTHLKQTPKDHSEALEVLNLCKTSIFKVSDYNTKKVYHSPEPAFKTSVFQQESGKRYNISPKDSMRIAQNLYEKGKITYHRTDITRLSDDFILDAKNYIKNKYGDQYLNEVNEKKNEKKAGEQAAHEAIRPTDVNELILDETFDEKDKLLYKMIWVRAIASLMAKEECDQFSINISLSNTVKYFFTASYLLSIFLGFKILTKDGNNDDKNKVLMTVKKDDILKYEIIESNQSFTESPKRYTESSLVKELENKGIGRPSTYANIITTIQARKYCVKQKSTTVKKECIVDTLKNNNIISKVINVNFGDNKQRIFATDLGSKVTDFLASNISNIMDYSFTSSLETELDDISNGNKDWIETVDNFTKNILSLIGEVPEKKQENNQRSIGKYNDFDIDFYVGQYGPFIKYKGKCYSLPKDTVLPTIEIAIQSIEKKEDTSKYLISYPCKINNKSGNIHGLTGPYGNYLQFKPDKGKSTNYFLPKNMKEDINKVKMLTLEECLEIVKNVTDYKSKKKS